jgi:small-conductance mechanosensitive channel
MAIIKNREIEQLKKENARLKAALSEAEFENQRLTIMNSNLENQLAESNRELGENIEVLQSLKGEIENLVSNLQSYRK